MAKPQILRDASATLKKPFCENKLALMGRCPGLVWGRAVGPEKIEHTWYRHRIGVTKFSILRYALLGLFLLMATLAGLFAQVPDAAPPPPPPGGSVPASAAPSTVSPAATTTPKQGAPTGFLGNSVPVFNPSTELLTWDGKSWNINDNRLFQARFEKYLNAPEETTAEDERYRAAIKAIVEKLAPGTVTVKSLDEAFRLLPQASRFDIDAGLCDGIADAVYAAWQAMNNSNRLVAANAALERERKAHEWNARLSAEGTSLNGAPGKGANAKVADEWAKAQTLKRDTEFAPYSARLAETLLAIKSNQAKKELSELQMKIEFQALMLQLFLQRRFQHVIIASRFYRAVFVDGDTALRVGTDTKDLFARGTGAPPTVATLDTLANEAMRDAREGVQAYEFLVGRNELQSATQRLAEAFTIGEYMPELRTLAREKKRLALAFSQKSSQLISSLEVKDYALAEKVVHDLEKTAKDFDNSKPMAAIETAKTVSTMHMAKARNAAVSGDKTTLETELRQAAEMWPRNPALADVSSRIFDSADVQQKALADLEQLLSQHNYRQIFDDKVRFIAAVALYPDRQAKLKKVLDDMQEIESAIIRASEITRHGDAAGAWEQVEETFQKYPEDNKLNQVRANLTTEAAEFVRTLRTAQELERKGQIGASLAWFLKARKLNPGSEFGKAGIERLVKQILPEK